MKELISIIIPIYNVEHYIEKCVNSIIRQSYKNLEIILINDGSTDNSGKLCDIIANKDNRIRVIHKLNGGLSDARNIGIKNSKGKYIAFIDSDDYVDEKYIEVLLNNLQQNSADISISNYSTFYEGESVNIPQSEKYEVLLFSVSEGLNALFDDRYKYQFTMACGKLMKKSILENFLFPVGRNYEDSATAHILISKADRIVYTDRRQYFYLIRKSSITNSDKFIKDDVILAMRERAEWFENTDYKELAIKAEIQYVQTLMGVYSRVAKGKDNLNRRKKIYYTVCEYIKSHPQVKKSNKKYNIQLSFFILLPKLYAIIIKNMRKK